VNRHIVRLGWRIADIREGLDNHYPICCVLRYATCRKYHGQAWRRGTLPMDETGDEVFVVCGVFHR
jgi:hypothetical protein